MSLTFILGPAGSGKSQLAYEKVLRHAEANPAQSHLIIVPEQFTLSTQKKAVLLSKSRCILNTEVLSFERTAYRVFDELLTETRQVLEDVGKSLLLRRICERNKDRLSVLTPNIRKSGFIDELKSFISELAQYNISPEDLSGFLNVQGTGDGFKNKINDIRLLYEEFSEEVDRSFVTAEKILELLIRVAHRSELLRDAYICLDGFTGFTPIQNELLREIFKVSSEVYVTLAFDVRESLFSRPLEHELFFLTRQTAGRLRKTAREAGVEMADPIFLKTSVGRRFKRDSMLSHLEKNIFRPDPSPFPGDLNDEIQLYCFADPSAELEFTAAKIRELTCADKDLRYSDIAVLTAGLEDYRYPAAEIFSSFDIPLFIDQKVEADFHPFVELTISIPGLFSSDFSYESVMRYLKCGMSGLTDEETDILDNYLYATGIRGYANYKKIFALQPGDVIAEDLARLNEIREKLIAPFLGNELPARAAAGRYTEILYQILVELDCGRWLQRMAELLDSAGDESAASVSSRIYGQVMGLFDKIHNLIGGEELTIEEYMDVLSDGMSSLSLGLIPRSSDMVTFGDIERTRVDNIKVIFLVGADEGHIPKSSDSGGLLSQAERERLLESDIVLAPTDRQQAFLQRFYLYLMLTRASERIYITYPSVDASREEAVRPSYLVGVFSGLFPGIEIKRIPRRELNYYCLTEKRLRDSLSGEIREYTSGILSEDEEEQFLEYFSILYSDDRQAAEMLLDAAFYHTGDKNLKESTADVVVGDIVYASASRLELYASCAYAYFAEYILGLRERKKSGLQISDIGSLYHAALEIYSDRLLKSGESWFTVKEDTREKLLAESIDEAYMAYRGIYIISDRREAYVLEQMRRTLRRTVWALEKQVRRGRFTPDAFEIPLSDLGRHRGYPLEGGKKMILAGTIDRMDILEEGNRKLIKIIDYKSGARSIDLAGITEGLKLQLPLYMRAVTEAIPNAVPSAMLYYHIDDPIVDMKADSSDEEISAEIFKKLKNRGFVNGDPDIVDAMDSDIASAREEGRSARSGVIPVVLNKNGSYSKVSDVLTSEEFDGLLEFVEHKACDIGSDIAAGKIAARPYRRDENDSGCSYCPYHSVCGFDTSLPGNRYRDIPGKLDKAQAFEIINRRNQR